MKPEIALGHDVVAEVTRHWLACGRRFPRFPHSLFFDHEGPRTLIAHPGIDAQNGRLDAWTMILHDAGRRGSLGILRLRSVEVAYTSWLANPHAVVWVKKARPGAWSPGPRWIGTPRTTPPAIGGGWGHFGGGSRCRIPTECAGSDAQPVARRAQDGIDGRLFLLDARRRAGRLDRNEIVGRQRLRGP